MKRIGKVTLGVAGAMLIGGALAPAFAATCGDVNGNGSVDSGDAVLLASRLGGANGADCGAQGTAQCGDINKDGVIGVADLVGLAQRLAGQETTFFCTSAGTPECGPTLSGTINTNRRIAGPGAGCNTACTIDGTVLVAANTVLTVDPGVVCKGRKTSTNGTPSVLIFLRDAKINANGTGAQPIVFTSDQAVAYGGSGAAKGDWGGVVINGRAPVNFPGGVGSSEGLPIGVATYGGDEPNDSSGVLRFARVEFSGIEFSADNELNVLTMNALGRGTTMDHVQANTGNDDCLEWFGGTIRSKYMVATNCRDDAFDYQIGFTGAVQYGLAYQNASQTDGSGRQGIEGDNSEFGFDNLPRSNPNFCNMTLIGSRRQAGSASGRSGANIRRGSAGKFNNVLSMDWTAGAIDIDQAETVNRGCTNATTLATAEPLLRVQAWKAFNTASSGDVSTGSAVGNCTADQLWNLWGAAGLVDPATNTGTETDPQLGGVPAGSPGGIDATFPTTVDDRYFPPAATLSAPNCGLEPGFFDNAPYIGAFAPGGSTGAGDNWLSTTGGWISFAIN